MSSVNNAINNIITGVTNASNATAGQVGEFVTSQILNASAVSLTTATAKNITSISLTAGDWDIFGNAWLSSGTASAFNCWCSLTSATLPDVSLIAGYAAGGVVQTNGGFNTPYLRVNVNTTTTVYLTAQAAFTTGSATASGGIFARRVR